MVSLLRNNLIEIYQALTTPGSGEDYLPVTVLGDKISYSHSLTGAVSYCVPKTDWQITEVVTRTLTTLFDQCFQDAYKKYHHYVIHWINTLGQGMEDNQPAKDARLRRYKAFVLSAFGEIEESSIQEYVDIYLKQGKVTLTESQIVQIRKTMIACSEAIVPFWQFVIRDGPFKSPLTSPLKRFFEDQSSFLTNSIVYQSYKVAHRVIALEGILNDNLPIVILAKLGSEQKLSSSEEREIKEWIQKLNQNKFKISLPSFLKVLRELVQVIQLEGHYPCSLQQLLLKLDTMNCEILRQEERKHMKWRKELFPGRIIKCNGVDVILGPELGKKIVNDQYRVFSVRDTPGVVRIAKNRLHILMQALKAQDEKEHCGFPLAEIIPFYGRDVEGTCEVIEKLYYPLHQYQWTSNSFELSGQEEKMALVLAIHLFYIHAKKITPEGLDPQFLMFDSNGGIKALRLFKPGEFNYNVLEQFCLSVSKGNRYVVDFLMHVSRLADHQVAEYYRGAVEHVFETGKTDLISRPQGSNFYSPIYETCVEKLCAQAIDLRRECFKYVVGHLCAQIENLPVEHFKDVVEGLFEEKNLHLREECEKYVQDVLGKKGLVVDQLKENVYAKLLALYQQSSTPGTLFPEQMKKQVLDSFLNGKKEEKPSDFKQALAYYKQQIKELERYNNMARMLQERQDC